MFEQPETREDGPVLPHRVSELRLREITLTPRALCLEQMTPARYVAIISTARMDRVNVLYALAYTMRMEKATPFAAVRLFDRYVSTRDPVAFYSETNKATLIAVACLSLAAKLFDRDCTYCGSTKGLGYFEYYTYPNQPHNPAFSAEVLAAEMHVASTLEYNLAEPTPHEYITECTRWLDPDDATRGSQRPEIELSCAREALLMCDAFVHEPESLEYRAWEMAAAATYVATETLRGAPQAYYTIPPSLAALWSRISWSRGHVLCSLLRGAPVRIMQTLPDNGLSHFITPRPPKKRS